MWKVLIVDDEAPVRQSIIKDVDWASLHCLVAAQAADGLEGLEQARRFQPQLIVTDIHMPRLDGLEMLRTLRSEGCEALFIFLTARDDFPHVQSALRLGAADYLLKPFRPDQLSEAVARLRSLAVSPDPRGDLPEDSLPREQSKYVSEALDYIRQHYAEPGVSVGSIAKSLGLSEGYLSHTFKKETGCTVLNHLTRFRIHKAAELLRDCRVKVYEVAQQVGYRDVAHFSATFKKLIGMSPSEYQSAGLEKPPLL